MPRGLVRSLSRRWRTTTSAPRWIRRRAIARGIALDGELGRIVRAGHESARAARASMAAATPHARAVVHALARAHIVPVQTQVRCAAGTLFTFVDIVGARDDGGLGVYIVEIKYTASPLPAYMARYGARTAAGRGGVSMRRRHVAQVRHTARLWRTTFPERRVLGCYVIVVGRDAATHMYSV